MTAPKRRVCNWSGCMGQCGLSSHAPKRRRPAQAEVWLCKTAGYWRECGAGTRKEDRAKLFRQALPRPGKKKGAGK